MRKLWVVYSQDVYARGGPYYTKAKALEAATKYANRYPGYDVGVLQLVSVVAYPLGDLVIKDVK